MGPSLKLCAARKVEKRLGLEWVRNGKPLAILICNDCMHNIMKQTELVAGSPDPSDVRCPQCGSASFACGYCIRQTSHMTVIEGELTWNCYEGCNP